MNKALSPNKLTGIKPVFALGIMASPREAGNCDLLLDKALEGAHSAGAVTEKIILNKIVFSGCQACGASGDNGRCIIEDDFQKIFDKVQKADIVIAASPVFFGSLSGQMKIMIDRFQCLWRAKYLLKAISCAKIKHGGFICVQAAKRKDFFENAKMIVTNFFAVIGAEYNGELFYSGLEKKGDVLNTPEFMRKAFELGARLAKIKEEQI